MTAHRRWVAAAIVVIALVSVGHDSQAQFITALAPGDEAPRLRARQHPDGDPVSVDWKHNKLTLVNFWATWCQPCLDEMPRLQDLWDRRGGDGLLVLGLTTEKIDPTLLQGFLKRVGADYPILRAPSRVRQEWGGIDALPTSFLVDDRGRIVRRYVGATPGSIEGLLADVENVLDGKPLGSMVLPSPDEEGADGDDAEPADN